MSEPAKKEVPKFLGEINIDSLEKEWVDHVRKVAQFDKRLADARDTLARAKANCDVVSATVSEGIRKDPLKYRIEGKVTEGRMDSLITLQKPYQQALAKVNDAKHRVDILAAAMNTLEHEKEALRNLVILWQHSYFGDLSAPKGADDATRARFRTAQKRAIRNPN